MASGRVRQALTLASPRIDELVGFEDWSPASNKSLSADERERLLKEFKGTDQWPEALGYLGGLAREDQARKFLAGSDPDAPS